jgi:glycosyltransferase involved in cell wall biosynthesis
MRGIQVSVVLTTRNRAGLLAEALRAFAVQNVEDPNNVEIVVVDNASTDNTKKVVDEISATSPISVSYVYEATPGYQFALNRGVTESRGEWIAFCDDDQLPHPDMLETLRAAAIKNRADCVGGTTRLRLEGDAPHWLGPVCRGILGEHVFKGAPARCDGKVIPAGGNMMVARRVFDAIGMFDTALSAGNDMDILLRARAAGFSIWAVPAAETRHLVPEYRLSREYLRWVSLRWGSQFAEIHWKTTGGPRTLGFCLARSGLSVLVRIPMLAIAYLRARTADVLDLECLLWRAWAYARKCLYLISPATFPQSGFFDFLDFRTQRDFAHRL